MPSEPLYQAPTHLVYIPNHAELAKKRLLTQDWSKPRIAALAESIGATFQVLEDIFFDLIVGTLLTNATGVSLNQWGALVGEQRLGLDDDDYRRFIQARILVNVGTGTPDELLSIFQIITAPSSVRYWGIYPAYYILEAGRQVFLTEEMRRRIRRMMADANPAGVGYELIEYLPGSFGFDGDTSAYGYDTGVWARVI